MEQGYTDGLQLLDSLLTLETSLNYLYVLIEQAQQEDSSPGKASSTATLQLVFKTIADSRGTVQEIMAHVTSTLALCALEVGESALCVDMSRCHVKLFEGEREAATAAGAGGSQGGAHSHDHSHGHEHESRPKQKQRASVLAMWVLRGRAFAALGE